MLALYKWIYMHTTGEPWTRIMRRNPWMLLMPGATILFGLGVMAGHVFWGAS